MKVILAETGYRTKAVGLVDNSIDLIEWMKNYLNEHDIPYGPPIYQFQVTEFDEQNNLLPLSTMLYPVLQGTVS